MLRKKRTDRVSTSKWHQRWPGKALQRKNIVLRKKMRNYRCSLYWFEHLVVSRFIHPSVILSFVFLIYRGLSPVYKWGNLNLWKLKQLKILYQTFWFKHRKKQVIKINSQWVETLHIYNMEFLYRYNLRTWLQYWILVIEISTSCLFIIYLRFIVSEARPMI